MSRFYRDLHDRELLNQAELILSELHRRRLLDIRVPAEAGDSQMVRCPVQAVLRHDDVLSVVADRDFGPIDKLWTQKS